MGSHGPGTHLRSWILHSEDKPRETGWEKGLGCRSCGEMHHVPENCIPHKVPAPEAAWKCHQGWKCELQQSSSAGGDFSEVALRRSVEPPKFSIFLKKLKITPEFCDTDLISYKKFYQIFNYVCKNLPSNFCGLFIKWTTWVQHSKSCGNGCMNS